MQWCRKRGCRGCKRTPKSFDLVKIRQNLCKIRVTMGKICDKLCKSVKTWKSGQKWRTTWVWFEGNGAQRLQNHMKTFSFFGGHPNWRSSWINDRTKSGPKMFRASLGKFRKKSFAPPKICRLLHLWFDVWTSGLHIIVAYVYG